MALFLLGYIHDNRHICIYDGHHVYCQDHGKYFVKVSREQVEKNRRKILKTASRLFRERGFEAVTVAEVMKAAGLTHGGFYGYFKSKDDLIVHALSDVLATLPEAESGLAAYAADYLSPAQCKDRAGGCPTAALASETSHQSAPARATMTQGLQQQIERLSKSAPGETPAARRQAAMGSWAAMVGAIILARMSDDAKLSDEMLRQTREWIGTGKRR